MKYWPILAINWPVKTKLRNLQITKLNIVWQILALIAIFYAFSCVMHLTMLSCLFYAFVVNFTWIFYQICPLKYRKYRVIYCIPYICPFWYATILFGLQKSTPKKCVNLRQKQRKFLVGVLGILVGVLGILVVVLDILLA